jgi:hypothetical protein
MVEHILDWLAAPVIAAQHARMRRSARALRSSAAAERRLARLSSAYRQADETLRR